VVVAAVEDIINEFIDVYLLGNQGAEALQEVAEARQRSQLNSDFNDTFLCLLRGYEFFTQ